MFLQISTLQTDSTSGDSWKSSNGWLSGSNDCEWEFVTCHESPQSLNGLVSALRLSKNNLIGTIPSEIEGIKQIEIVDLFDNSLNGILPRSISSLSSLSTLDVEDNELSGNPFTSLSRSSTPLSKLSRMRLSSNSFDGTISNDIGTTLINLKEFWIGNNEFDGTIPTAIGQLTLLGKYIYIQTK